jgi:hypothetical protein
VGGVEDGSFSVMGQGLELAVSVEMASVSFVSIFSRILQSNKSGILLP